MMIGMNKREFIKNSLLGAAAISINPLSAITPKKEELELDIPLIPYVRQPIKTFLTYDDGERLNLLVPKVELPKNYEEALKDELTRTNYVFINILVGDWKFLYRTLPKYSNFTISFPLTGANISKLHPSEKRKGINEICYVKYPNEELPCLHPGVHRYMLDYTGTFLTCFLENLHLDWRHRFQKIPKEFRPLLKKYNEIDKTGLLINYKK